MSLYCFPKSGNEAESSKTAINMEPFTTSIPSILILMSDEEPEGNKSKKKRKLSLSIIINSKILHVKENQNTDGYNGIKN